MKNQSLLMGLSQGERAFFGGSEKGFMEILKNGPENPSAT